MQDISNALVVGLNTLNSEDVKVSSKDIEALAEFKGILKAILNGKLVIASPDRIKPEEVDSPKGDIIPPVDGN